MESIDLKAIIDRSALNEKELAKRLFPLEPDPEVKLNNIIFGFDALSAIEVAALCEITGLPQEHLSTFGWTVIAETHKITVIKNGAYVALADKTKVCTTIYLTLRSQEISVKRENGRLSLKDISLIANDLMDRHKEKMIR